ncbi:hypothetical protein H072_5555 [Dactylellina haptotyla CBS 200.50]|uniref:Alanine--tRNA ligase n=1 Tax=Dactylellina haptotyla (strain CBS 200.50) TaxID=1284197 RepID=S8ACE0_DACHA|nr:hypothetical protein H072_5555 [Dactylellina haptotyla CBS 200.50]
MDSVFDSIRSVLRTLFSADSIFHDFSFHGRRPNSLHPLPPFVLPELSSFSPKSTALTARFPQLRITPLHSNSKRLASRIDPPAGYLLHRCISMATTSSVPKLVVPEWPAAKVRETFFKYFESKGHEYVKSSPCVPVDDKTLLFANAGMNQYKSIFLGTVDPNSKFGKLKRAHNSQKCIRAGGKHNDLEDVGKDSYHHTFFEMLGNWSFGDYFKKEAIAYSWELLTQVFKLNPDRLYVTYFGGDTATGLPPDLETKELWARAGVREDHILPGNLKDNFWEMGDQGPCGPCTEIHYDRIGGGRNAAHLVNMDDPNVLEIWNNVFIQFNREADKSLKPLPHRHVDTGMGFERLVSILQDKPSNYDTDVFTPLFRKIQEVSGMRPYQGKFGKEDPDQIDTAYRVIADHLRTLSFGITDGGLPSNEGRGYVLRRIVRRGARYARRKMNVEIGSFFSSLLPTLVEQMSPIFPELKGMESKIRQELNSEEVSFAKALDKGEKLFEDLAQKALKGDKVLTGTSVWELYGTYGFPIDLTRIMAEELDIAIDEKGLLEAEKTAKEISKQKKTVDGKAALSLDVHALAVLDNENIPRTNDDAKFKWGKDAIIRDSKIVKILVGKEFVPSTGGLPQDEQIGILLDKTCMYAEQGGQIYDFGTITVPGKAQLHVKYIQPYRGHVLHCGTLKQGNLKVGDIVEVEYDEVRRRPIRINHTATHILNFALRDILGEHVGQKGSLVDPEKTRFDFTNDGAVDPAKLEQIERKSNAYIQQNLAVYDQEISLKAAEEITGVRAVFGEKYPDPVRVVSIGIDLDDIMQNPKKSDWRDVSIEFCGGTHLKNTGDIKELLITEESGIGKGIRRIVAVTESEAAKVRAIEASYDDRMNKIDQMPLGATKEAAAKALSGELNTASISCVRKAQLKNDMVKIQKAIADDAKARAKAELKEAETSIKNAFSKGDKNAAVITLPAGTSVKTLTDLLKSVQKSHQDKAVYLLVAPEKADPNAKVNHACYIPESAIKKGATAPDITTQISKIVGGGAGKSKDGKTSQGAGNDVSKFDEAVDTATKLFASLQL